MSKTFFLIQEPFFSQIQCVKDDTDRSSMSPKKGGYTIIFLRPSMVKYFWRIQKKKLFSFVLSFAYIQLNLEASSFFLWWKKEGTKNERDGG